MKDNVLSFIDLVPHAMDEVKFTVKHVPKILQKLLTKKSFVYDEI